MKYEKIPVRELNGGLRRHSLFYTLKNKHAIKWAVAGWRGYCLAVGANTYLRAYGERNELVERAVVGEKSEK